MYHIIAVCLNQRGVNRFGEVGTVAFGASLLLIGQGLRVLMSLGLMAGANYQLVQIVTTIIAVCFGFGFSFINPALSDAASNAVGKAKMVGRLEQFRGLLRWAGWWPWFGWNPVPARLGSFPLDFGACINSLLLVVMTVLKHRPTMQPQYRQP